MRTLHSVCPALHYHHHRSHSVCPAYLCNQP